MILRRTGLALLALLAILGLGACGGDPFESAADTANHNLSEAAENFEVPRRITGINTLAPNPDDAVLFTVEGFCSSVLMPVMRSGLTSPRPLTSENRYRASPVESITNPDRWSGVR